nr:PfkB family carbohydrate kinase [Corynebacterium lactis]
MDTTGCGDSYIGTLLTAIAAGRSVAEGAQVAAAVSAYAATGVGAQSSYGTTDEVIEFLAGR